MNSDTRTPVPPGWYHDGGGLRRWWDGFGWTAYTDSPPTDPSTGGAPSSMPIPREQQARLVSMLVANAVSSGWRVEYQGDDSAVVVRGRRPNHVLHLLLTIFTLGLWGTVWVLVSLSSSDTRKAVRVDDQGNVLWQ